MQVPGSVTELVLVDTNVKAQFRCGTITAAQPFEIQENDVIAACVWDDGATNLLFLAGDNADTNQLYCISMTEGDLMTVHLIS